MSMPGHSRSRSWLPWFVLAVSLACTAAVSYQLHVVGQARQREAFENAVNQMGAAVTDRINNHVALLQTTAGFFAGLPEPGPGEFRRFVNHLQLDRYFPGVDVLGFAPAISHTNLDTVEARGGVHVWPASDREVMFPVLHAAPQDSTLDDIRGWDLASDAHMLDAMHRARDRASATFTAEIRVDQPENLDDGHVFVFLPVYDGYEVPDSQAERSERLSGFAFLMLDTDALLERAVPHSSRPDIDVRLYDVDARDEPLFEAPAELVRKDRAILEARTDIPIPGRRWVLEVRRWPSQSLTSLSVGAYAAILGSLVSLLLFCIVWIQVSARATSERYAEQHRRSEERLRQLNETLEQRVTERTAEAERRSAQLRAMALQLSQAEQKERRRLAQILHDDLQQMLVAVRLRLDRILRNAGADEQAEDLTYADELVSQAIQTARSLSVDLSPPILRERGLATALDWLARKMYAEHGLTVHLDIQDDAAPDGDGAKHFIVQAVRELLFNVVKHAGVDEAWVSLDADASDLKVVVRDHGKGISDFDESDFPPLDEHFGLANIRHRIDLIGGSSELHSSPGEGTTVAFRVPRQIVSAEIEDAAELVITPMTEAIETPVDEVSEAGDDPEDRRIRVLLVDDHKMVRQGLAGLLAGVPDIELVGEASDGLDALDKVRQVHPDVVVMDITMPRMNGIEATRHITMEHPGVRVIGLSMHEKDDMEMAIRAAGAETYLSKDGASTALIDAIRGVAEVVD